MQPSKFGASITDLSPEKRELLLRRLSRQRGGTSLAPTIPRQSRDSNVFPLSYAQQRLWFLDQLEPGTHSYNISRAFTLTGSLNRSALERSLNELVRRHEALRTTFSTAEGRPVQVIAPTMRVPLQLVDLGRLSAPDARAAEALRLATAEARRPFDLTQGPLVRATLLRLAETEHVLILTVQHIVADGWSLGVFYRELAALYTANAMGEMSPLPELPIQYADYAVWQREWLQGETLESQIAYWRLQLLGVPAVPELPTDHPRPRMQTYRGAHHAFTLPLALLEGLQALSQREGVTLFMTLLAAFQTLLQRYSGQDDVVVGTPIANRTRSELEDLVGFFANTLVLRTDLSGNPSFRDLLQRVREVALGAYAHQDLPFEKLVEEVDPQRDMSHTPLFQIMFVLENASTESLALPGLTVQPMQVESGVAKSDLTLFLWEEADGLAGSLEYNTDLFEAATIAWMVGHLQTLLEGIVANPDCRLMELPLLTEAERNQLLVEWNATQTDYPRDLVIPQLFEAQVAQTPEAVAVVCEGHELTYRELNRRANQLAHHLQRLGVSPDGLVGLCVERSLELVVGLLGILKAGGAYVPLDPAYPPERLAFMLADARVPVLLTQQRLMERLPVHGAQVICLDTEWGAIAGEHSENPSSSVLPDHLAYVIYTSGSTGQPKGVALTHRGAGALLAWAHMTVTPEQLSGVLASTSVCFDLSVFELLTPLTGGGRILLAENALELPHLPTAHEVTLLNTVPSAAAALLRSGGLPPSVQTVALAGEPLPQALVDRLYQQASVAHVYNLYGPTETTTYSTWARVPQGSDVPPLIGRPIANTQAYVLDDQFQPMPVGVPGQLYLGGAGLARGYLHRPDLTAERFSPHPFSDTPGARLYKTGDLVRYLPSGDLEYLGRLDHQVKIRGFRIELGEIEAALSRHPAVRECAVLAREDTPGAKHLVAYVVAHSEQPAPTSGELRRMLQRWLPDYMLPSTCVMLEALPVTPNGKVDRRALPVPDQAWPDLEARFVAPRTPAEQVVAQICADLLGVQRVGIYDSFFDSGGHSLLATQVVSRLRTIFQIDLPLRSLFEAPTVEGLVNEITRLWGGPETPQEIAQLFQELEQFTEDEAKAKIAQHVHQTGPRSHSC